MSIYDYKNYTGTQAWPEFDPNYDENFGKGLAGTQRFDINTILNRRLPSHLSQDMGASTFQAPTVYPGQRNIHEGFGKADVSSTFEGPQKTGILQNVKNWGKGLLDNTMIGRIAAGFNATNPNAFNFSPLLEGQLELAKGGIDEGGLGWGVDDIGRFTSGPLAGQASTSAFGTNNLETQLRNRLQKIRTRKIAQTTWSRKTQAEIQAAIDKITAEQNKGYSGTPGGNTGSGVFSRVDNTGKTYGPYSGNQGNQGDQSGGFSGSGAGTGAQGPAGGQSSQGNYGGGRRDGPSGRKAYGGRIGYAFGRGPVLDENVDENILEFMQDQGVPHGEMVEGKSPFEMRIDELMDTGMSWQEAYEIASEEFGQIAEGESDQGLASIV